MPQAKRELEEILHWIDRYTCEGTIQEDLLVIEMRKAFPAIKSIKEAKVIWDVWRSSLPFNWRRYDLAKTPEGRLVAIVRELLACGPNRLDLEQVLKPFIQKERLLAQIEIAEAYRFGRYPDLRMMLKVLDVLNQEIGRVRRSEETYRKKNR